MCVCCVCMFTWVQVLSDSSELELLAVRSHLTWILRVKLRSSERDYRVILQAFFRVVGLLDHLEFLYLFSYFRCWCSNSGPCVFCTRQLFCHWAVPIAICFCVVFLYWASNPGHCPARQVLYYWATSPTPGLPFLSEGLAIFFMLALEYVTRASL